MVGSRREPRQGSLLADISRLLGEAAEEYFHRVHAAGSGWHRQQGHLRALEHFGEQSVGHAASCSNGPASLSGNQLVWKAGPMKLLESFKQRWVVLVWNHTPN